MAAKKKSVKKKPFKRIVSKPVRKVNTKPVKKSGKKVNWILTLIMSVVLGWLAVDRFIMGHVGLGILKLLITLLSLGTLGWIWWIIDIVLVATKHPFEGIIWVD